MRAVAVLHGYGQRRWKQRHTEPPDLQPQCHTALLRLVDTNSFIVWGELQKGVEVLGPLEKSILCNEDSNSYKCAWGAGKCTLRVCGRCVAGMWLALQMGFSWSLEAGSSTYMRLVHLCRALSVPSATGAQAPSRANRASRESRVKFLRLPRWAWTSCICQKISEA